jgi:hypothetical protein
MTHGMLGFKVVQATTPVNRASIRQSIWQEIYLCFNQSAARIHGKSFLKIGSRLPSEPRDFPKPSQVTKSMLFYNVSTLAIG